MNLRLTKSHLKHFMGNNKPLLMQLTETGEFAK